MPEYKIKLIQTLSKNVTVTADNESEATKTALDKYFTKKYGYVLNTENSEQKIDVEILSEQSELFL